MYRAYVTRAAEFGNPEWNNTPLIEEILKLRREAGAPARVWRAIAELSLEPKSQECHRPGQIGPMPLLTYEDAVAGRR